MRLFEIFRITALGLAIAALTAFPAVGQQEDVRVTEEDEWYDPTDWFDYDNVDVDYEERSDIEWEADEGYHEEEWYDPSDWFDADQGIEYEYDWWDYGYDRTYDPYDYDYDYGWDAYDYDPAYYDYDADYYDDLYDEEIYDYEDQFADIDYDFDQTVRGEVLGLRRVRAAEGSPESVVLRLRTEDGNIRNLFLGDRAFVEEYAPRIRKGERIHIRGHQVQRNGKEVFRARQIRGERGQFTIPDYQYGQTLHGNLVGLKRARTQNGDVQALIAKVKTQDGRTMDVLLGSPADLRRQGAQLRPGSRVEVDGWTRSENGERTFNVQNVRVLRQPQTQQARQGQRMQQRQQQHTPPEQRTRQRQSGQQTVSDDMRREAQRQQQMARGNQNPSQN